MLECRGGEEWEECSVGWSGRGVGCAGVGGVWCVLECRGGEEWCGVIVDYV